MDTTNFNDDILHLVHAIDDCCFMDNLIETDVQTNNLINEVEYVLQSAETALIETYKLDIDELLMNVEKEIYVDSTSTSTMARKRLFRSNPFDSDTSTDSTWPISSHSCSSRFNSEDENVLTENDSSDSIINHIDNTLKFYKKTISKKKVSVKSNYLPNSRDFDDKTKEFINSLFCVPCETITNFSEHIKYPMPVVPCNAENSKDNNFEVIREEIRDLCESFTEHNNNQHENINMDKKDSSLEVSDYEPLEVTITNHLFEQQNDNILPCSSTNAIEFQTNFNNCSNDSKDVEKDLIIILNNVINNDLSDQKSIENKEILDVNSTRADTIIKAAENEQIKEELIEVNVPQINNNDILNIYLNFTHETTDKKLEIKDDLIEFNTNQINDDKILEKQTLHLVDVLASINSPEIDRDNVAIFNQVNLDETLTPSDDFKSDKNNMCEINQDLIKADIKRGFPDNKMKTVECKNEMKLETKIANDKDYNKEIPNKADWESCVLEQKVIMKMKNDKKILLIQNDEQKEIEDIRDVSYEKEDCSLKTIQMAVLQHCDVCLGSRYSTQHDQTCNCLNLKENVGHVICDEVDVKSSPALGVNNVQKKESLKTERFESNSTGIKRKKSNDDIEQAENKKNKLSPEIVIVPSEMNINRDKEVLNRIYDDDDENFTKFIFDSHEAVDQTDPSFQNLVTNEDYFKSVRRQWHTHIIPNPHKDLTKRFIPKPPIGSVYNNSLDDNRSTSLAAFCTNRISMVQDKINSIKKQINHLYRCNSSNKVKKMNNDIDHLSKVKNEIEKNKKELNQINMFYHEKESGWDAQYLTKHQHENIKSQDEAMECMKQFYK